MLIADALRTGVAPYGAKKEAVFFYQYWAPKGAGCWAVKNCVREKINTVNSHFPVLNPAC